MTETERSNYDGISESALSGTVGTDGSNTGAVACSWVRSGYYNYADYNDFLSISGNYRRSNLVSASYTVRPAFHLNLKFVADSIILSGVNFELEKNSYEWTGEMIEPKVVSASLLIDATTITLSQGTDFTVSYKNNINVKRKNDDLVGEYEAYAQVIITGIGEYGGKKVLFFTITPKNFADMTFDFSFINKTYTGGEQDAGEKVVNTG